MAYSWQSDIIRPDGENGTEVLDGQGVYQPQIEGGSNITIENGRINASGTLENVNADWAETDPNDPSYIEHKPDLSIYATASGMETALAGKQDVIDDLSTIRSGAEAGSTAVQPGDLAAVATTGSYTSLTNTPQNIVQDANYVHSDNNFSNADKSKLDGIAAGAEVNVQADWNEADSSSDAYIANKPTIPAAQVNSDWNASSGVAAILNKPDLSAYATDSELTDGLATKQDVISDLDTIRAGAAAGATAAQPSDLPSSDELLPSASSGDAGKILSVDSNGDPEWITPSGGTTYSAGDGIDIDANNVISADVDGTTIGIDSTTKKIKSLQTIPTKTSDLQNDSNFVVASSLATVATSGSYADLSNKPNIPTKTSDLQNDSNFVSSSSLATVATTGSYNDLSDKPSIPSVDQSYNAASSNAQSGVAVAQAIAAIPAAPVEVVTNQNSFELEGDNPVKVEFTRVEDTSVIIHTTVDLTPGSPVDDDNQTMVIAFDLDAVNKAVDDDGPVLKINTALPANSGLSQFQWGFNDSVSTSGNYSNYIQAGSNTSYGFPSGEIDLCNPGTIGTRSYSRTWGIESNTKRYFIVKAVFGSTYKSAISTWMSNGNITIKDWPTDGYGNKVVIPNIPASTSADANKVLTVDSNGDAIWQNVPTPSVDEVPDVTSSDDGKVLKASYSGGQGSYAWGTASSGGGGVSTVTIPDITFNNSTSTIDSTLFTFNDFTVSVNGNRSSVKVLLGHPTLTNACVVSQYYRADDVSGSVPYSNIKTYVPGAKTTHPSISSEYVYQPQDLTTPISLQTEYDTVSLDSGLPSHFDVEVMYSDNGSAKTFSFKLLIWSDIVEKTAWSTTYALHAKVFISAA